MNLTTVQQVYHEFKICDDSLDSEEDFVDLDLVEGSCFAMDDDRAFSNASDFSDITGASLPSNTSHTTSPRIDDGRSFSNISNFSQNTSESLILSDTLVTTLIDEIEDSLLESSDLFSDDGRSFSDISNFSLNTFESKILSDTLVTTLIDEIEDSLLESSDLFSEDHVSFMVVSLTESRHMVSTLQSIPTKPKATSPKTNVTTKGIDKASFEQKKQGNLVSSYKIQRFDVLSGRGGKSNHHIGNKVFRHLVTELKPAYRATVRKIEKARLAESLMEKVHQMGGHFLIQNHEPGEPQWRFMTKREAQRKTSQALRETRKHQWTHGSHFASAQSSS